ncbi:MAG: argininosuccinate lyase [Thermoplasmatales archaeon]|jgi:argininosuccinate lyase|nr:argininosuccinate lyase [Thermoplasmatales archaeon]
MEEKALWSGRFDKAMSQDTLEFTSSLGTDVALAFYDIMGSLAHVRMLKSCKILPAKDADTIIDGLKKIVDDIENGTFEVNPDLEDIHTNIEHRLTDMIGPDGGRLHTGRSRNDQVATDFRMYMRDMTLDAVNALDNLIDSLITISEKNGDTILPGYTHMQHAQPVTLSQHMLAHAFRFDRDGERFLDAYSRMNRCPLGAAALAGTTYPIDRDMTSQALGFSGPTNNSMDTVSDRDFVAEILFCASLTAVHISSLAEELVLWSSQEFGFVEMDEAYSTGSSIMPQKKNPDVAELARGMTGSVVGSLMSMLVTLKGLPFTYNRDLQEDKRPAMEAMYTVTQCAMMMASAAKTMKINKKRMKESAKAGFMNATDLADYLVVKGIPFREAHGIVGAAVKYCVKENKDLESLTLDELRGFSASIDDDVFEILPLRKCVERRNSYGGTSSVSTNLQRDHLMNNLTIREEFVYYQTEVIEDCWDRLLK